MVHTLSIGERLSNARHALNKKRSTVAEDLNIRESYIEAIENNDYSVLPGKAYVSGFIKSYSEYLGLDPEDILKMLKATQNLQESYENMPQQIYKDYQRTRNVFVLSVFCLFIVIAGFSYYSFVDHEMNIRKIENKASSTETLTSFFNQTQKKDIKDSKDPVVGNDSSILVKAVDNSNSDNVVSNTKSDKAEIELYAQKSKPPFARVLLKAKKDVWFQIRPLHKNRIYVSKTLPKGKYYWVTPWENVVLDVSSANNLEIIIDEKNMGQVGSASKRVKGLFLDVKSLNTYYEQGENRNNEAVENYYKNPIEMVDEIVESEKDKIEDKTKDSE